MSSTRYSVVIAFANLLIHCYCQNLSVVRRSHVDIVGTGFVFTPNDYQALFRSETFAGSLISCARLCTEDILCRIFDYDSQSHRCRTFEGNFNTMGMLMSNSSMPQSAVGSMELSSSEFYAYGQPCSSCQGSRYLTCRNGSCVCPTRTYFDGSKCESQKLLGDICTNGTECRQDLNYTCLPRQQCGPLSLQNGVTVGGYGNGVAGSGLDALSHQNGIDLDIDDTIYVCDSNNNRVIKLEHGSLMGSVVAGNGISGSGNQQFSFPLAIVHDNASNLYISDYNNNRVMFWAKNATVGRLVAGTGGSSSATSGFDGVGGIVIDSMHNLYIGDRYNHRVMKWTPNATTGILLAGTGIAGSASSQLNEPHGIYVDEEKLLLYVADYYNHRIQQFSLNGSTNGITVAGGNGPGAGNHQLNYPFDVLVSKKNGDIYIADYGNHRIQCWRKGANTGVTVAGSTGVAGATPALLNAPACMRLNTNETMMYVSDSGNSRIQRFTII